MPSLALIGEREASNVRLRNSCVLEGLKLASRGIICRSKGAMHSLALIGECEALNVRLRKSCVDYALQISYAYQHLNVAVTYLNFYDI